MFIGRRREMESLNRLYHSGKFEFAVIYGRRRVGKTALIREFIRDRKALYFMGIESNEKQNLRNFSQVILDNGSRQGAVPVFQDFQTALESVFIRAEKERIILVIDEYPYVARSSPSLASVLQRLIDTYKSSSKLFLILCGSSMSYMEDEVLAYKSPLYGRRTAQFKILPFSFEECLSLWHGMEPEDQALLYGVTGGTPPYVLQMDTGCTVEENVKRTFLDPSSFLYEEPENLLKQEVREPALYNAIISAVAQGATRISEISSKTGESTSIVSSYIRSLMELGVLEKETPYGEKPGRKTIYRIADNMFRFLYRFIPENASLIERGAQELAWQRIYPHLPEYMGSIFESICQEYLWNRLLKNRCPVLFSSLGRWWGNDPVRRKQTEIDIMGEESKEKALFGECKWRKEEIDLSVLETLEARSHLFHYQQTELYLFAKSGFTKAVQEKAGAQGHVHLVAYLDMWKDMQENSGEVEK